MTDEIIILSENPIDQLWLHLSNLESVPLARRALSYRAASENVHLDDEVLDRKAIGVAYALRSARDYLERSTDSETKRVLSAYYSAMSFLSALLIADPKSKYDLVELEAATKAGHGLGSIDDENREFPCAQHVYVTNNGFLHRYLKMIGVDPAAIKIARRIDSATGLSEDERKRSHSLDALLARVPELTGFYFEVTRRAPRAAHVFLSERSHDDIAGSFAASLLGQKDKEADVGTLYRWISLRTPGLDRFESADAVKEHLQVPLQNLQKEASQFDRNEVYWTGAVELPAGVRNWQRSMDLYKSPMCPTSWFAPLFGQVSDPLVLHFASSMFSVS